MKVPFVRVFFVVILFSSLVYTQENNTCPSSAVLGTDGGYDVGGGEPICFVSRVNATFDSIQDTGNDGVLLSTDNTFDLINSDLYQGNGSAHENSLILLSKCFDQTQLSVSSLDMDIDLENATEAEKLAAALDRSSDDYKFVKGGTVHRFRIAFVSNLTNVNPAINTTALGSNFTIHTRINFCNALQLGFCSPLEDTTDLDLSVTPFETDVGADIDQEFPSGDDRWEYDPNITLKGLVVDEGNRVVTRWVRWRMKETTTDSPLYNTTVDVSVTLPKEVPMGAYFVVGHVVMNFDLGTAIERIDIADAALSSAVLVVDPPLIQEVTNGMIIYVSVLAGVFGLAHLLALVYMVMNRQHPAMRLAQGGFLIALVAAGLTQTIFSFVLLPLNDAFCAMQGLMTLTPMHIGGCVVVARIWRVHVTLSSAMKIGRTKKSTNSPLKGHNIGQYFTDFLGHVASLPFLVFRCGKKQKISRRSSVGFRDSVSAGEATSLACMLSLPQCVLQVFSVAYYRGYLVTEIDSLGTSGRIVCDGNSSWVFLVGMVWVGLVYLIAVYLAWLARNLPSAFNEKDQVFQSAGVSALLAFVNLFLASVVANDPTESPNSLVCMSASMSVIQIVLLTNYRYFVPGFLQHNLNNRYRNDACMCACRAEDPSRCQWRENCCKCFSQFPLPYVIFWKAWV